MWQKLKPSLVHSVRTGSVTHPASYPTGTGASFAMEVKRPDRVADHSQPMPRLAMVETIFPLPPLRLLGAVLSKLECKFTIFFTKKRQNPNTS
jgi:hypothetical protein